MLGDCSGESAKPRVSARVGWRMSVAMITEAPEMEGGACAWMWGEVCLQGLLGRRAGPGRGACDII